MQVPYGLQGASGDGKGNENRSLNLPVAQDVKQFEGIVGIEQRAGVLENSTETSMDGWEL